MSECNHAYLCPDHNECISLLSVDSASNRYHQHVTISDVLAMLLSSSDGLLDRHAPWTSTVRLPYTEENWFGTRPIGTFSTSRHVFNNRSTTATHIDRVYWPSSTGRWNRARICGTVFDEDDDIDGYDDISTMAVKQIAAAKSQNVPRREPNRFRTEAKSVLRRELVNQFDHGDSYSSPRMHLYWLLPFMLHELLLSWTNEGCLQEGKDWLRSQEIMPWQNDMLSCYHKNGVVRTSMRNNILRAAGIPWNQAPPRLLPDPYHLEAALEVSRLTLGKNYVANPRVKAPPEVVQNIALAVEQIARRHNTEPPQQATHEHVEMRQRRRIELDESGAAAE